MERIEFEVIEVIDFWFIEQFGWTTSINDLWNKNKKKKQEPE